VSPESIASFAATDVAARPAPASEPAIAAETSSRDPHESSSEDVGRRDHFPCFDGLRALAALCVVVFHVAAATGVNVKHPTLGAYTARLGGVGVAIFFVISGFLLYRPFAKAHLQDRPDPSTIGFYRRRFLRIFPAYWLVFTLYAFVLQLQAVHGPREGVLYYGLLQLYGRHTVLTGLAQTWSLGTEVSFYVVLPLLALIAYPLTRTGKRTRAQQLRAEVALVAALYLFAFAFRGWLLWAAPKSMGYAITWLPARLDWFAVGMALAVVSAWATTGGRPPRVLSSLAAYPVICWAFAAELVWVLAHMNLSRAFEPDGAAQQQVLFAVLGVLAFFVVLPAVLGRQESGVIRRLLRSHPVAWLGVVSYGIFLWHTLWIREVEKWGHDHKALFQFWPMLGLVLALTTVSAAATYYVVERPALKLKRPGSVKALWDRARVQVRRLVFR